MKIFTFTFFLSLTVILFSCHDNVTVTPPPDNKDTLVYNPTMLTITSPFSFGPYQTPPDNPTTKEGVALGRMLFYEKMLSLDNSISCANCHKQHLAFADSLPFSKGVNDTPGHRSAMSLSNLLWLDSTFFWDGRAHNLEDQVHFPVTDPVEMNQPMNQAVLKLQNTNNYPALFYSAFGTTTITGDLIAKAISQFERTLISSNSRYDQYLTGKISFTAQEKNGMSLFLTHPEPTINLRGGNCNDCHSGILQSDKAFRNNGLDATFTDNGRYNVTQNNLDKGKFRVPSLRNIALTAPYMHDGRFNTLEEVLDHYNEHIQFSPTLDLLIIAASNTRGGTKLGLTDQEKEDIIVFLHTLTDSSFITDPDFANPFTK